MIARDVFRKFLFVRAGMSQASTMETYKSMTRGFFDHIGQRDIRDISQEDVAGWIHKLRSDGASPNTIIKKMEILKPFFAWCRPTFMTHDPMVGLPVVRPAATDKVPFTWEQFQLVMEAVRRHHYWPHACIVAWHTGLRMSDCANLRWDQIDFISDVIHAQPQKMAFRRQKLVIPMEPELRAHLIVLMDRAKDVGDDGEYVHPGFQQRYARQRGRLVDEFRVICDGVGLTQNSFHSYRHGMVSRLLNAGADISVVSAITGQSYNIIRAYAHISTAAKSEALARSRGARDRSEEAA